MLVERDLSDLKKLQKLDLIVIPYLPLLSEEIQNRLISYVELGGNLLILGSSGVKNQYDVLYDKVPLLTFLETDTYPKSFMQKSEIFQKNFKYILTRRGNCLLYSSYNT